ncbi:MAG: protein of unknown function transrane [Lachnospiraceae bacterium]|nr:protein of unknown function transrane [Lachnospiraceae bacterium]
MKNHIYVLMSVVLWGTSQILMDSLNQICSPALLVFLRFLFSGTLLTLLFRKGRKPFLWRYFITGGLGCFGYYILTVYAMVMSSVSFVAIMGGCLPILAVIFDSVIVKQKVHKRQVLGAVVSLLGSFFYSFDADFKGTVAAGLLMVIANLLWLIYCYLKKKWGINDDIRILGYEFICTAILTLPLSFCFYMIKPINLYSFIQFIGVVLLATILPYWLYQKGSKGISLNTASMYMNLLPVTTLLPVLLTGGISISEKQILGIAVLILSALVGR